MMDSKSHFPRGTSDQDGAPPCPRDLRVQRHPLLQPCNLALLLGHQPDQRVDHLMALRHSPRPDRLSALRRMCVVVGGRSHAAQYCIPIHRLQAKALPLAPFVHAVQTVHAGLHPVNRDAYYP